MLPPKKSRAGTLPRQAARTAQTKAQRWGQRPGHVLGDKTGVKLNSGTGSQGMREGGGRRGQKEMRPTGVRTSAREFWEVTVQPITPFFMSFEGGAERDMNRLSF